MAGETDLDKLLSGMDPELDPEEYVFARDAGSVGGFAICRIREPEGECAIVRREDAEGLGIAWTYPCRRITLRIHSSLDAVGLLARVTGALAAAGISVNVISGYYHDYLFVPVPLADAAIEVLWSVAAVSRAEPAGPDPAVSG